MNKKNKIVPIKNGVDVLNLDALCRNSVELIQYARRLAVKQINATQLMTFYSLGRWIVEEQQQGESRAKYGQQVIAKLSETLSEKFGRGFSVDNLENMRRFYLAYKDRISETAFRKFALEKSETASRILDEDAPFRLSCSHYLILSRIKDEQERLFYEREAVQSGWSVKQLQRQHGGSLYERLLLSSNKDRALQIARDANIPDTATAQIKDPYVLEFLGLQESPNYTESELETRIIDHLQEFLLEMGKGYSFVGRQVRFTFDEDHFWVDLVLYNRLLKCFVLIDLKTDKLKHQDLGQMQMYVNYYDRFEKTDEENPTIGLLLCSEKNDNMVELTLPEDANIYASKYELYLPDKKALQEKLVQWIEEENGSEEL